MVGELTATMKGQAEVGSAALKALIDSITLPAATDFLFLIPTSADGRQVSVVMVVRA